MTSFTVFQSILVLAVCTYIYVLKDHNQGSLYYANLSAERAQRATETERQRVEAWRGAFEGILDGVFDASCTCGASGAIQTSTPHLDSLLLGVGGVAAGGKAPGLLGRELTA